MPNPTTTLFTPIQVGSNALANRIFMAPLTRTRAGPTHVPNALMAEYYAQRASAGLIVAECTMIAPNTSAFGGEPGLYTSDQFAGWKRVTDAVHAKGGKIFLQIWHGGRAAHPDHNDGHENVAPSALIIEGEVHTSKGKVPNVLPRALTEVEIAEIVQQFATAASNAINEAGFDGVEIHGANGYLIDQFLRDGSNHRTDGYGGSLENRTRFLSEVVDAVTKAVGADKVGIRFSPLNSYNSMLDSNPEALSEQLAKISQQFNLAYVHVMRADFFQAQKGDVVPIFRHHFKNVLIVNMGYTKDEANEAIANGLVDAVAFGTAFLANPDLPIRFAQGAELNAPDSATFYTGDAKGYTDYPTLSRTLFTPIQVGSNALANRIFMAPLTRTRAGPTHVPNALMAEYYAQRASAGLIVAECTMIAPNTSAFGGEPGLYTSDQFAGWKRVTDAVHAKGGKIFLQIWHGGRAAHPDHNDGHENVAPSALIIEGEVHTSKGKVPNVLPRALTEVEIAEIVQQFATAASNAINEAGFDGVEIHGANGYLIDQFLRDGSNHRTDGYGGSLENRTRFLSEVVDAVTKAVGADKVGIRFSPLNSYNSMLDSNPEALSEQLAKISQQFNLAYVHVMRADFFQAQKGDVVPIFRHHFKNVLIVNMGYTKDEANEAIANGLVDAVAFGTAFLANPDLPARFAQGAELNAPDSATFYTGDAKGYTDYPFLTTASPPSSTVATTQSVAASAETTVERPPSPALDPAAEASSKCSCSIM
ncbi:hypothetical protein DYB28_007924 [Aphanomyces astaci]|uniref:NADH:flavin oxidoreductase/NADH oxidase N-terminal domain-containing protein n=1 Tax=Aphanomyces astaci TaxID=112090 RepID=A0A9X8E7I6_APHAT|nr:hypothetical protein DYB28_007924 [Aphanomyces astaci]